VSPTKQVIAFVLPNFSGGGAQRVTLNLLRLVDVERFIPLLIVLQPEGPLAEAVPEHVQVIRLNRRRMRQAILPLLRLIRKIKPAIVFSTFNHVNVPILFFKSWMRGTQVVVREANMPSANVVRMPMPWLARLGYIRLYPRADTVIATSEAMVSELIAFKIPGNLVVKLRNPVFEQKLRQSAYPSVRQPGKGLRFVAVGRLSYQKGFDRLFQIMRELPQSAHCLILGDGPERPFLDGQLSFLNLESKVTLQGFVSNPAPFIAGADALVMPSRFEGMPNAALEALAVGTPVIATPEAGGLKELESVIIKSIGEGFREAMSSCRETSGHHLRASLLPREFHAEHVASELNALLAVLLRPVIC
jgi:glycosyltransferase involved in cell wall biosynthesis